MRFCGNERGACGLEKKVDLKCMELNALKNIARMTRRLCFYHATYACYSDSSICSCLNIKEVLAQNRRDI